MTAPAPYLSPIAGLFNALLRHVNRRLRARIADLNGALADAINLNHQLTTAADFRATDAAGYIDRTGLEA